MPRVTTWKVPLVLWLFGFVAKAGLSILVSDTVGSWVGGAFGFLALVTTVLWAVTRQSRERDGHEDAGRPSR